jgi:hypothetical protein
VLAASGLLAGLGVGAGVVRAADGPDETERPGGAGPARTLPGTLVSRDVRIARPGPREAGMPRFDSPRLPYGGLETSDGRALGSFDTSQLTESRRTLHLQRIELDDGGLVGLGVSQLAGTFTVIGASGRYAGASGTYTVRDAGDHHEFSFDDTRTV